LRCLFERALVARADRDLHDLAVRRKRLHAFHSPARQQRSGARDDVIHLGYVFVVDCTHGRARLGLGALEDADADVVLAHVHDLHLSIPATGRRVDHSLHFGSGDIGRDLWWLSALCEGTGLRQREQDADGSKSDAIHDNSSLGFPKTRLPTAKTQVPTYPLLGSWKLGIGG